MTSEPINLSEALASFDQVYRPRIVTRMNDYGTGTRHDGAIPEHVDSTTGQSSRRTPGEAAHQQGSALARHSGLLVDADF